MNRRILSLIIGLLGLAVAALGAPSLMEALNRGVVALRTSDTTAFVSWRLLGLEHGTDIAFNLYRSTGGGSPVLLNDTPLTAATNYTDTGVDFTQTVSYLVRPVVGSVEQATDGTATLTAGAATQQYLSIPLTPPPSGTTPGGTAFNYTSNNGANDCTVADLDGDGEYEVILRWEPSVSWGGGMPNDSGKVYIDAYKLNGTRLWRIDLGFNLNASSHITVFLAYDFDGDGKAELACMTADGTVDGAGAILGSPTANWRNAGGSVLTGPQFLTVFNGQTGAAMTSTRFVPQIHPDTDTPTTTQIEQIWGDNYGNRMNRFLGSVAYLDGRRPSFVFTRGYYTGTNGWGRTCISAWDWRDGQLTQRWVFDTYNHPELASYLSQGNHNLAVGDVDGDGRDEVVYGSCTINDDGAGKYSTSLGHGDAIHMSQMDPSEIGQKTWTCHEEYGSNGGIGLSYRDAATGTVLLSVPASRDIGRAMAEDLDPNFPGYEMWGATGGLYNAHARAQISTTRPSSMNSAIWWDGDLLRELLDGGDATPMWVGKWNPSDSTTAALLTLTGTSSNNSTKANACLSADVFGDWREEIITRTPTSDELRIYTTIIPTSYRIPTLMHDRQYRLAISSQNGGYNQPPNPSFFLGDSMAAAPVPDIVTTLASLPPLAPAVTSINRYNPLSAATGATAVTFRTTFNTAVTGVDLADFTLTTTGVVTGTITSVTVQNAFTYDIVVGSITGTGTLRLDLNTSGTGITSTPANVAISGGFTTGETFNRATLTWTNPVSGGSWSNATNWDGGVIANGIGAIGNFNTLDITADNTVILDSARTLSGLNIGDTNTASAASWILHNNAADANVLTLDVTSSSPILTINALGAGATATIDTVLAGTDGLIKAGTGTLVLTKPNTLTGALTVSSGILRIGSGGTLTPGTVNLASGSQLNIAGGTFTTGGLITAVAGSLVIDSGTATFNAGYRTNSTSATTLRLNGGTLIATDINMRRTSAGTVDFTSGFIAAGGNATLGTVWLGNDNSNAAMSVEGGSVTTTGAITLGNNAGSSRGGGLRVTSGALTCADTANGIVLTRATGNTTLANISGGVTTTEKITFGYNSAVIAGSGTLTLSDGALYLGSGGIVKNGINAFVANLALNGGTLGAKANWSTLLPLAVNNTTLAIKAADAADTAHDITLGGALTGAGSFTKTGGGTLILSGPSTNSGSITVAAGTLEITGSLAAGGTLTVNPGAVLTGNGVIGKPVTLAAGAILAPTGTITGTEATWNPGAVLALDIGPGGDLAVLSGNLIKGTAGAGPHVVNVLPRDGFEVLTPYTLATFASTDFVAADFVAAGLPAGSRGACVVNPTSIQIVYFGYEADAAFNEWLYANGVPAGQRGATDDPDADGVSNLLEFVLGTGPLVSTPLNVVPLTIEESGETYPAIQFNRRQDLGGVAIEIRADIEPGCAANHGVLELSAADRGDGVDAVVVRSTVPLSAQPRQFMRVFASLPSPDPM